MRCEDCKNWTKADASCGPDFGSCHRSGITDFVDVGADSHWYGAEKQDVYFSEKFGCIFFEGKQ